MSEIIKSKQYLSAVEIDQRIKTTAKALAENLFDLCGLFYRMSSEKLYKELGYQNFADYCENEVGITKMQGTKYARIGESFIGEKVKSTLPFEALGTEKLYLLARLDEPEREEIQQTVNLEDVSVRELKAEIARLKEEKAAAETAMKTAEDERNKSSEELMTVQGEKELIKMQLERRQKALDAANEKITELENRPVEVAVQVQDNPEDKKAIQRLKNDLSEAKKSHTAAMEEQQRQYAEQISALEVQLSAAKQKQTEPVTNDREIFRAYYMATTKSFELMLQFVSSCKDKDFCRQRIDNLLSKCKKMMEGI